MQTDDDDEFTRRADRLRQTGELLFGARWQSPIAELLGVSQPTIANIVSGKKDLSADLEDRLGRLCIEQADALSRRSIGLARLAVEIADDRRLGIRRLRQSHAQHEHDANAEVDGRSSGDSKANSR